MHESKKSHSLRFPPNLTNPGCLKDPSLAAINMKIKLSQGLRAWNIMPSSYIRTGFFFSFLHFHFHVLLNSPNHGLHRHLKRLPAPRRCYGLLGPTITRSRTNHSIHSLLPLWVTTTSTSLFLSKLDPSIIKPVLNMCWRCRQTKEKPIFPFCNK